jgi:prolyl-tRNA editing enzyme YbaK/EbsC (Cys-tRNA(Pro) deacylase)
MSGQSTPVDLQRYMETQQIAAQLIQGIGETPTVPAAAVALGVAPEQIIKTLLFLVEKPGEKALPPEPIVVISNGERRVDKKLLADHFKVGNKRIKLAPAEVVLELLGYPAGGVPPFGHRTRLPTILDATVMAIAEQFAGVIYGGGGDHHTMMKLTVAELVRVVQPEILAVS